MIVEETKNIVDEAGLTFAVLSDEHSGFAQVCSIT
jgi:peroxiredoxin